MKIIYILDIENGVDSCEFETKEDAIQYADFMSNKHGYSKFILSMAIKEGMYQ